MLGSLDETLQLLAQAGAGWVLWLLVGLSVAAVAIIVERALFFLRSRDGAERTDADVLSKGALAGLSGHQSFEAQVLAAGLASQKEGTAVMERRMRSTLQRLRRNASSRLGFLGTVGANAPFMGLLGTVIGIIRAFQELDASQGEVTAGLMAEVGEALIATAVGILVAIPAVAAYNYFQQLIEARSQRAEASADNLLAAVQTEALATSGSVQATKTMPTESPRRPSATAVGAA